MYTPVTLQNKIQACADKLRKEMEDFGYPPKFPDNQHNEKTQPAKVVKWYYDILNVLTMFLS